MSTQPDALPVLAAGGVVVDAGTEQARVLVVHRPAYGDWSLPKGHVEKGETLADTATREVLEETGVEALVTAEAGTTTYPVILAQGPATKQVHWFLMRPLPGSDPTARPADAEVDEACWWPVATALEALTHRGERELLERALQLLATGPT